MATDPMRIRARMEGEFVDVKVIMPHPMETGLRQDADGNRVPAHFIRSILAEHEGRTVLSARWGAAVSRNPFLHFRFKGGKPGQRITVTWTDTAGERRTDQGLIAAS